MSDSCVKIWDWQPLTKGATRRATQITSTDSDLGLSRVVVTIEPYSSDTASLTLDSDDTGVTINDDAAGAWDYTIDEISAATTDTLSPGYYTVTMTLTQSDGSVVVASKGVWKILAK